MRIHRSIRRWTTAVAGVTTLTLLIAGCSNAAAGNGESDPDQGVYDDTVTVGMSTDVTGPAAANLAPYLNGAKTYFDKVNKAGGISGRKVDLAVEDDKTDATLGVAAYRKFVNQEPALAMMGTTTAIQAAIAAQGNNTSLPLVGPLTVAQPFLHPLNPSFYSTSCTYGDQADVASAFMIHAAGGKPKVFIVRAFNASGEEWVKLLTERANLAGATVVGQFTLENGALDYDVLAQNIAKTKPDVVLAHGSIASAQVMMQSFRKFGLHDLHIGTTAVLQDPVIPATAPSTIASYYSFDCYLRPSLGGAAGQEVMADAKASGFGADKYDKAAFTQGYVAAKVVTQAIKDAGDSPTRAKVIAALDNLHDFDTGGLSPTISFAKDKHQGVQGMLAFKWDAGSKSFKPEGAFKDYAGCITNYYVTQSSKSWSPGCIK